MIFICDHSKMSILTSAARDMAVDEPTMNYHVNLSNDRLITIARVLGMEELQPAISNEEAMQRLGLDLDPVIVGILGSDKTYLLNSPAPENTEKMQSCEICGKPVKSKRSKTCSDECKAERTRRYQREYMRKIHSGGDIEKVEDAMSGDPSPLSLEGEETFSIPDWGLDPGDEPIRVGGL